jgi:hypothetical protein
MIATLTPEQEDKLEMYRDKWLQIGLSTDSIDGAQAIEGVHACYTSGGLTPPAQIIFSRSPYEMFEQASKMIRDFKKNTEVTKDNLLSKTVFGNHEAHWLAFYEYFQEVCGLDLHQVDGMLKLAKSCGWVLPFEHVCFVSDRPKVISLNAEKKLHRDLGKAVEYRDGTGVYSLNGIVMEEWMVMTPAHQLDAQKIMAVQNVDQRRELLRKLGIERFITKIGATVIDTQSTEDCSFSASLKTLVTQVPQTDTMYELLDVNLGPEIPHARFLKMWNPSIGVWHVEGVAPECRTVQQAINFRAGDMKKPWKPRILT